MAGELIAVFLMCALTTLLFLRVVIANSWSCRWVSLDARKDGFFFFVFAMVKAITPRYRYDQLMRLGWKVFLPISLGWVIIVAFLAKFNMFGGACALGNRGLSHE